MSLTTSRRSATLHALLACACFACFACDTADPDKGSAGSPDAGATPTAAPPPHLSLRWGGFARSATRPLLDNCHLLDAHDVAVLYASQADDFDPAELAPYFGVRFDQGQDDAARTRAMRDRMKDHLETLDQQLLCIEHDLLFDRYDFDDRTFTRNEDQPLRFEDRTPSGADALRRIRLETRTEPPAGFTMPLVVSLQNLPSRFKSSPSMAEGLIDHFEKARSIADLEGSQGGDQPPGDDDAPTLSERFDDALKLHPDALEALLTSRSDGSTTTAKPLEAAGGDDGLYAELITPFEPDPTRAARAYSIVRPTAAFGRSFDARKTRVHFKLLRLAALHTVVTDGTNRVIAVGSGGKGRTADSHFRAPRRRSDDEVLRQVCTSQPRFRTRTVMRAGALADVTTTSCQCPSYTGNPSDTMTLEAIAYGGFTAPGLPQALVLTEGCESFADGPNGAVLLQRAVDGEWVRVAYTPGTYEDCRLLDREGQSHVACLDYGANGGEASGSVVALDASPGDIAPRTLFPIHDDIDACRARYLKMWPTDITRRDGDLVFTLAKQTGNRPTGECDADSKPTQLEIAVSPGPHGLQVSPESEPERARLAALAEGR